MSAEIKDGIHTSCEIFNMHGLLFVFISKAIKVINTPLCSVKNRLSREYKHCTVTVPKLTEEVNLQP